MRESELLANGVAEIIPENGLEEKLRTQEKLIVKLGFDPTAPDLHLGHAVVLRKLRDFQKAGHQVIVIIGDFTAQIGDPTGRDKTRPPLSEIQIQENASTYLEQLSVILEMETVLIKKNSTWLNQLTPQQMIALLAEMTVAQMLQRNDFNQRFKKGEQIRLHEFTYPLLQGMDSLEIKADVEIGGKDQLFNTMVGRQLQQSKGEKGQVLIAMPLLRGLDGQEKMSKSKGNWIGLTEVPEMMFAKVMSIPDELIEEYLNLASTFPEEEKQAKISAAINEPMAIKKELAFNITKAYHNHAFAQKALLHFERNVQNKGEKEAFSIPAGKLGVAFEESVSLLEFCLKVLKAEEKFVSNSETRRLIIGGSVSINGEKKQDLKGKITFNEKELLLKIGKRNFYKIVF